MFEICDGISCYNLTKMLEDTAAKVRQLKAIETDIVNLKSSPLYNYRLQHHFLPVVGEGDPDAKIVVVGEAPGYHEAVSGHHFQGPAGGLFDQLMNLINIRREEIYITNIVKDKLPQNRSPRPNEIESYAPFLIRQIKVIKPKIIVTLGKFASEYLLRICKLKLVAISQIHGRPLKIKSSYGNCFVLPCLHPAAALYRPELLIEMKKDFKQIAKLLKEI